VLVAILAINASRIEILGTKLLALRIIGMARDTGNLAMVEVRLSIDQTTVQSGCRVSHSEALVGFSRRTYRGGEQCDECSYSEHFVSSASISGAP
jgi:hypothetical protein